MKEKINTVAISLGIKPAQVKQLRSYIVYDKEPEANVLVRLERNLDKPKKTRHNSRKFFRELITVMKENPNAYALVQSLDAS